MSQIAALYRLQEIELAILEHQKRLQLIAAELEDDEALQAAQATANLTQQALSQVQTQGHDLDLQIQSTQNKQQQTEQRLYGGTVKNPKELQDMQQEVASLKKRQQELEDHMLETMVEIEEAEDASQKAQAALQQITQTWETDHQDLINEKEHRTKEVKNSLDKRKVALKDITPDNLKLYNSLRSTKANRPLSVLEGNNCSVCGIQQTTSIVQDVRADDRLIRCINCGRILFSQR